ncbi:MAG: hypothetical protein WKF83_06045 [Nocardioidaceae bacterium]
MELTGTDAEYAAWQRFYAEVGELAQAVAPTLLAPLPPAAEVASLCNRQIWAAVVEEPLGVTIEDRFDDDLVRGVVATDALIGTSASLREETLVQNRCFLYHLIGNATGECGGYRWAAWGRSPASSPGSPGSPVPTSVPAAPSPPSRPTSQVRTRPTPVPTVRRSSRATGCCAEPRRRSWTTCGVTRCPRPTGRVARN